MSQWRLGCVYMRLLDKEAKVADIEGMPLWYSLISSSKNVFVILT